MSWRLAKSLETLRTQVNEAYPNRSKLSDGTIGDSAHQAVGSDHNPNSAGVVTALDLTHHAGYFDAHKLADTLITNRHPNLKYVISNRRIAGAWSNWRWVPYAGINPHDKHIHISVGVGEDGQSKQPYDDETKWNIGVNMPTRQQIIDRFRVYMDHEPTEAQLVFYSTVGGWSALNDDTINYNHSRITNYKQQLADLKVALANEQSKPPREVVKEVEKIVEKIVEVEKVVEVEPSWLTKVRDFVSNFLKKG